MDVFVLEGREGLDHPAGSLLAKAQLVELLQVEPEFRTGAEEVRQAQSGIAADGPPAVENLGDTVRGDGRVGSWLKPGSVRPLEGALLIHTGPFYQA